MAKRQVRTLVVEGGGTFPFDMLRYCRAWPYGENDSYNMDGDADAKPRQVKLEQDIDSDPAGGRWRSFGWTLIRSV